ncbi:M17 family metallopeptidase [Devosia sp.]|uniref:leucyl aminopeptidase family protein n=1 Tax=Devosia sp. TaxID=1871048 RepID=UPI0035AE0302
MADSTPIPLICVGEGGTASALDPRQQRWAAANGFAGQRGRLLALPDEAGNVAAYLFGLGPEADRPPLVLGLAGAAVEAGVYRLAGNPGDPTLAALGFRLGAYRFDRYRRAKAEVTLVDPEGTDADEVARLVEAAFLARDLINTPANDLGPAALEAEIRKLAARHGIEARSIVGDELLAQNFPMIHAVGRAAAEAPRLLELVWGRESDPAVTLVGKGVTFDTGGLDIKPSSSMALMKKDMGGAANVLGLTHAIVDARLPVRLRVLIPIVENAISAPAFRPGDVLRARNGMTVEIGNTDAEGRLILADALALADEAAPELVIDMATLTGAARVALGPDLPPLYSTDDNVAEGLLRAGRESDDPLWRLPLHAPYESMLGSKIADINNAGSGGFAGSITAALFMKRFVSRSKAWAHLDIYGWAPEPRPGRPLGGTDQGIRAVYFYLKQRYS